MLSHDAWNAWARAQAPIADALRPLGAGDTWQRTAGTTAFLAQDPVRRAKTGQTPHRVIFRQNKARVLYFAPAEITRTPVFISMPLINTWTIFDLLPGRSVIETLLAAGAPVYLLDWGRPGPEDQPRRLTEYADTLLGRCIDRSRRHAGVPQLDAVGYCVGGTFLAIHLARHPDLVRRVAFVATPIDFHASGRLSAWADPETFPLDDIVDGLGNFPPHLMRESFAWLRPSGSTRKYVSLWQRIDQPGFPELWAALERWNGDNVPFPGECYREYVRRCYFDNALMHGDWVLNGTPVDLSQATIPALTLAGDGDHIVPPAAAHALEQVWGGPVETQVVKGGHVGICVGKRMPAALVAWIEAGA